MKTAGGFYTVPKDRAEELFGTKLDGFEHWICLQRDGCFALFVCGGEVWESHWTCLPKVSGLTAFRFCRDALPEASRLAGTREFVGLVDLMNKKGLKMVRLLGYIPLGFKKVVDKMYLVCIKEIN